MFGVLRFVIQSFSLALEKATSGNAESQDIEQASFEGRKRQARGVTGTSRKG